MDPVTLLPPELLEEDPLLDEAAELQLCARALDLEDWIVQRLNHVEREITVSLPLSPPPSHAGDDAGSLTVTGVRVQHSCPRAGCMGPVVLAPDAHIAQLRHRARQMTLQCALLDLPLGGSAGAIVCDPAQFSELELRYLVREYVARLRLHDDIFAPAEFTPAWTAGDVSPAMVVGKPAILGGVPDPAAAIAAGWFALISESLAQSHQPLAGRQVALQGFSPAVAALAGMLHDSGARIVALADNSGGLLASADFDLHAVSEYVAQHGMLYGFEGAEAVSNSDVLESSCDILITAAAERQVNARNAARIAASLVLEAVPNAVTPAAAATLTSRGVTVMPALLAAAPRTLSWFFEWQHGARAETPEQVEIEAAMRRRITRAAHEAYALATAKDVPLSDACRLVAMEKLAARWRLTI